MQLWCPVTWAIGLDIADSERLAERLQRRPALAQELFTASELAYCRSQFNSLESLAGRFAAKEAVVKALELDGWDPLDIEVLEGAPAPRVRLHGAAAQAARERRVAVRVSITHLPMLAAAVALAFPDDTQPAVRSRKPRRLMGAFGDVTGSLASRLVSGRPLRRLSRLRRR